MNHHRLGLQPDWFSRIERTRFGVICLQFFVHQGGAGRTIKCNATVPCFGREVCSSLGLPGHGNCVWHSAFGSGHARRCDMFDGLCCRTRCSFWGDFGGMFVVGIGFQQFVCGSRSAQVEIVNVTNGSIIIECTPQVCHKTDDGSGLPRK